MFLNYLTCVDHAFIDDNGRVVGGSYHPNFLVGGKVDEIEQVVVDFSKVKKQIKDAIDDRETGFDHKLWIIPSYSRCEYDTWQDQITIRTPACELEMPRNAVKIFDNNYIGTFQETVQRAIQHHVWQALDNLHPGCDISVECQLTTQAFMKDPQKSFMFRYVHGLKNSSSWGCQNHSHGHLSWIEVEHDLFYNPDCQDCRRGMQTVYDIASKLDGAILIYDQNIVKETDEYVKIQYASERGIWKATYSKAHNKIVVLDRETTIENIVDWVVEQHLGTLMMGHVKRLFVSEGLSKGAVREFSV
jgi:6-pyruvoyl-tetrahydropterin synthase